MNRIKKIANSAFLWVSFFAFLFLYIVQDTRINKVLKGIDSALHADLIVYMLSLLLLLGGWIFIYLTKKGGLLEIKWRVLDICLVVFVLSLLVTQCFWSNCGFIKDYKRNNGDVGTFLLLEGLALVALPSMMYVLAWMRENTRSVILQGCDRFLQGKIFYYICIIVASCGIFLSAVFSFNFNIWGDEAFTLGLIEQSYAALTRVTAVDVHPPLYYYVTKLIADSILYVIPSFPLIYAARLASTLPYVLMVLICMTSVKRRWGTYVAGLGSVALVAMPRMLEYSAEIRMYGWGMLWVTLCWLNAYNIICNNRCRDWICFVLTGLAAAYTHYWACVAAAIPYLMLAIWCVRNGSIMRWLIAVVMTVLGYLPWLLAFVSQLTKVSHSYSISPHKWFAYSSNNCITSMLMYQCGNVVVWLMVVGAIASLLYQIRKKSGIKLWFILSGIALPYLLVALGVAYSIIQPIILTRYLIPATGALWLGCLIATRTPASKLFMSLVILAMGVGEMTIFSCEQEKAKNNVCAFLSQIRKEHKPAIFVFPCYSWSSTVFSILTGEPSYVRTQSKHVLREGSHTYGAFGKRMRVLEKGEHVRDLLAFDKNVYIIELTKDAEEETKKIVREENLILRDEGMYAVGHNKFRLYRVSETEMRLQAKDIGNEIASER